MSSVPDLGIHEPEPAWDVSRLFPPQGQWNEFDYLAITASTSRLVELVDGRIEVPPMPTQSHQLISRFLFKALSAFVDPQRLGMVLFSPLRVRVRHNTMREPDIVFMLEEHGDRRGDDFWEGADLVMEVVSQDSDSRKRDLEEKRADYAQARIPEYWIVDSQEERITVLVLEGDAAEYSVHGVSAPGQQATSRLLKGFAVDVTKAFDAAKK